MGANTKAIIRKGVTVLQIKEALEKKYENVSVYGDKTLYINLSADNMVRNIYVSFSNCCENDYNISGVYLSLGCFGESVEILKYLCLTFGGYLDENDCDENGFYPINFHLYQQGTEFTKKDMFIHKIISKLGMDKLNITLELFDEYIDISKEN